MLDGSVIVLGSVNTDFVVRGSRLPRPGETVLGGTFFESPGGKGANQAVAAARAATRAVTFLAAVGSDRLGRESLARLRQERNLLVDYVRVAEEAVSGVALILLDQQGENLISVAPGANLQLRPEDIDRLPDEVFASARVLLASLESPVDTVLRALERAKRHGLITILNPAPALPEIMDSKPLELVDVITPNEHELAALTALPATNRGEVLAAARVLQAMGAKAVAVTRGPLGSVVIEAQPTWVDAAVVAALDTTAAGDAFNGALAVRLAEGATLVDASRWANCAAALSVMRLGAQPSLATREEIDRFAESQSPQ